MTEQDTRIRLGNEPLRWSDPAEEVIKAFCQAQKSFQRPSRSGRGQEGNRTYLYATIGDIWAAVSGPLGDNGLAVLQAPELLPQGHVSVETVILHTSGQWIRGRFSLPFGQMAPKAIGSAISYTSRYALRSMLGVVADDEEPASRPQEQQRQPSPRPASSAPKAAAAAARGRPEQPRRSS